MATVFKQLSAYQKKNRAPQLSQEHAQKLGETICKIWFSKKQCKYIALNKTVSTEPDGTFQVVSYPNFFIPEIDRAIHYFYLTIVKLPLPLWKAKKRTGPQTPIYKSANRKNRPYVSKPK